MAQRKKRKPRLNIRGDAEDWRAQILSNTAHTPFKFGGIVFPGVESFLQGIKFRDATERKKVWAMNPIPALKHAHANLANSDINRVYWDMMCIPYRSEEHLLLLNQVVAAKVMQNHLVRKALLETEDVHIHHDVWSDKGKEESPNTSFPEEFYIQTLLAQRKLLKSAAKFAQ